MGDLLCLKIDARNLGAAIMEPLAGRTTYLRAAGEKGAAVCRRAGER
jgi:hypothetical protein